MTEEKERITWFHETRYHSLTEIKCKKKSATPSILILILTLSLASSIWLPDSMGNKADIAKSQVAV